MNGPCFSWMESEPLIIKRGAFARRAWWRKGLYVVWRPIARCWSNDAPDTERLPKDDVLGGARNPSYGFLLMDGNRVMGEWIPTGEDKSDDTGWRVLETADQAFLSKEVPA